MPASCYLACLTRIFGVWLELVIGIVSNIFYQTKNYFETMSLQNLPLIYIISLVFTEAQINRIKRFEDIIRSN